MTQTPASGPNRLVTTPPIDLSSIAPDGAVFCGGAGLCWARARPTPRIKTAIANREIPADLVAAPILPTLPPVLQREHIPPEAGRKRRICDDGIVRAAHRQRGRADHLPRRRSFLASAEVTKG